MRAIEGASITITLKIKGTIDDLATCVDILPIGESDRASSPPSHEPCCLSFYHIKYRSHIKYNYQPTDGFTPAQKYRYLCSLPFVAFKTSVGT